MSAFSQRNFHLLEQTVEAIEDQDDEEISVTEEHDEGESATTFERIVVTETIEDTVNPDGSVTRTIKTVTSSSFDPDGEGRFFK